MFFEININQPCYCHQFLVWEIKIIVLLKKIAADVGNITQWLFWPEHLKLQCNYRSQMVQSLSRVIKITLSPTICYNTWRDIRVKKVPLLLFETKLEVSLLEFLDKWICLEWHCNWVIFLASFITWSKYPDAWGGSLLPEYIGTGDSLEGLGEEMGWIELPWFLTKFTKQVWFYIITHHHNPKYLFSFLTLASGSQIYSWVKDYFSSINLIFCD